MLPQIRLVGRDVLFVHWPVDPSLLRERLPAPLELDTFDGSAWVSIDLHELTEVGLDDARPVPLGVPQLDFRTYVSHEGNRGVYFLTCDTGQRVNSLVGSRAFALPFRHADISLARRGEWVVVRSRRTDETGARFDVRYRPAGEVGPVKPGSVPEFLIERHQYCAPADGSPLDTTSSDIVTGEVERDPWQVGPVEADIRTNTLFEAVGLDSPSEAPLVQYCPTFEPRFRGLERHSG
jgi:uncharacterized protein YqjF (DUF2071 family)